VTRDPITVLIADDHPMFRDGIRVVLSAADDVALVGEAVDGEEVVRMAAELQPEVVIMDLNLPGRHGIEATRQVVTTSPHIGVLVLTMFDDDESVFLAMRAGASGYLLKGAGQEELVRAIRTVASGGVILGPRVARRVQRFFEAPPAVPAFAGLTPREHEVLQLVAAGRSNPEIATLLHLSGKTVRNHVSNIFTKLQVVDRAQAIVRAREAGLGAAADDG
jgi:DNA-binding NarL/FixJ family response regulator